MASAVAGRRSWENPGHYLRALSDPWYRSLVDLVDVVSVSTFRFFHERGLKAMHLPLTTNSVSSPAGLGSDSLPVEVELHGVKTYLADSMQFMLEYGARLTPEGCYYLMASFRGEAADSRHLCQFYHAEAEIRNAGLEEAIRLVEAYILAMTANVLDTCGAAIEKFAGHVRHIENLLSHQRGFPRITLDEAVKVLGGNERFVSQQRDDCRYLTHQGERELIDRLGGFAWVTDFDHLSVPFYQAFDDLRTQARAADLLFGMGEILGAGERHTTESDVREALARHQVDSEPYNWYCAMKREHPMQTSGFGLGVERYICWLLQHDDIRDCQLLPRFNGKMMIP